MKRIFLTALLALLSAASGQQSIPENDVDCSTVEITYYNYVKFKNKAVFPNPVKKYEFDTFNGDRFSACGLVMYGEGDKAILQAESHATLEKFIVHAVKSSNVYSVIANYDLGMGDYTKGMGLGYIAIQIDARTGDMSNVVSNTDIDVTTDSNVS